jgi:GNAT superfamily N-acetyltransferase
MSESDQIIREATIADIKQMQIVRNSVTENTLSDPNLVTDKDCEEYITTRGKGWVYEIEGRLVGFAIVDLKENSIWALFVDPNFEHKGIGRKLHTAMMNWYFDQTKETVWLTTDNATRAEGFYRRAGWEAIGRKENGEIKFEMKYENWAAG